MSAARRKGNALEMEVARRLQAIDGRDDRLAALETPTGRLGSTYAMSIDAATESMVIECKSREDNPLRFWAWLDKLTAASIALQVKLGDPEFKLPVLVIRRNRRRPLVILDMDDFEAMVASLVNGNEGEA